ncbi:hypothetical protein [Halovivax gelatinilyticus]|uniref:hypothetical protein n=1 Tax=Halovivax gelatinilyticus TaxID=2961597 RepID=UPI0020CA498D|nr:hypothetical protein [Halovivax gelatinilyticus]
MVSNRNNSVKWSRRKTLAATSTVAIGSLAGCVSGTQSLDRVIKLPFVRLVNQDRDAECTFDITLTDDNDEIINTAYEGVPPARAPMSLLVTAGGRLHFGTLPGNTGVDTDRWEQQLPEVHTIVSNRQSSIDRYELVLRVSPPDKLETLDLWEELSRLEDDRRKVKDNSVAGLSIEAAGNLTGTKFHVFETNEEKELLEEFLDAEQRRQEHRDKFGEESVEDSPFVSD